MNNTDQNHPKRSTALHKEGSPLPPELQPLEIHPSVDPELARGLISAVEYIADHPHEFDMAVGFNEGVGTRGCVICHVERLSNWRRPSDGSHHHGFEGHSLPLGHCARIYSQFIWYECGFTFAYGTNDGRMARIEHFLRTGE